VGSETVSSSISIFRAFEYPHFNEVRKEAVPVQIMNTVKPIMKSGVNSINPKTVKVTPTIKPATAILLTRFVSEIFSRSSFFFLNVHCFLFHNTAKAVQTQASNRNGQRLQIS